MASTTYLHTLVQIYQSVSTENNEERKEKRDEAHTE